MNFDFRILIVLLPLLLAGGWAVYNIGALALKQLEKMNKQA
ncbi:MAG: photosystem II protein Y [Microcoleus sp. CSU_2_2]|jgi:photosystem II PsbY protein|nr:photosystem II protein Y [Microcoleus sp. SU_5_3]NJS11825.1 photosystem II protein Y [Microcoleus sp. CSU_2_2]